MCESRCSLCGNSSEKVPYYREKGPGVQGKRWPKYRYCFSCLKVKGGSLPSKISCGATQEAHKRLTDGLLAHFQRKQSNSSLGKKDGPRALPGVHRRPNKIREGSYPRLARKDHPNARKNAPRVKGQMKSFMRVPINAGNRSGSCSENCRFRIAQVVGCHSENGISNSENQF